MKKCKHLLLSALLAVATVSVGSLSVGCQAVDDFRQDNPLAYNLIAGTTKALLLAQVPRITDDTLYQQSLTTVIDAAFLVATTPEGVAAELRAGVAEIYPADPELQSLIADEFATALTAEPDLTAPASAPASVRAYQLELAAALRASVDMPAPATAAGESWSDPFWRLTSWFTGVDSYAAFRQWHSK